MFWDEDENYGGTSTMEPMYLSIQTKETGKKLLMENGYTVRDIQDACGLKICKRFISGFPEDSCQAWTISLFYLVGKLIVEIRISRKSGKSAEKILFVIIEKAFNSRLKNEY